MFADQMAHAIESAAFTETDSLLHTVWKAHAANHLTDDEAQCFAERLHARKRAYAPESVTAFKRAKAPPKLQRSPDKQRSIERRRRLARASPVPPELVDKFTQGEHAVLTVVAGEIQRAGACTWYLDRIAAVAGVCRTLVQNALRKARTYGLLFVEERRRRGQKSLTNIVRVLKKTWGAWLKRIGFRKSGTTTDKYFKNQNSGPVEGFGIGAPLVAAHLDTRKEAALR
jgi:hypothetical protein